MPRYTPSGHRGMVQPKQFRMQCLSGKLDPASPQTINWVADQGQTFMGGLRADLVFASGMKPKPQFGRVSKLGNHFVMSNGEDRAGIFLANHLLPKFIPGQSQPMTPDASRFLGMSFDVRQIFASDRMLAELFDQSRARFGIQRHAEQAAGVPVDAMNRQGPQISKGGRQEKSLARTQFPP